MNRKLQHEKFVINEDGTSILRYVVFCIQLSFSIFISKLLINTFPTIGKNRLLSFLVEFVCLHSFTIFSVTILDDYYLLVFGLQILIIYLILQVQIRKNQCEKKSTFKNPTNQQNKKPEQKNEMMRSISLNVLISTTIMILAVDFRVFPRRNGKVEHFGIGLMDAGAVCFLALNSILSPEVRILKNRSKTISNNRSSEIHSKDNSLIENQNVKVIVKCLKNCSILFLIGLIRMFTIKKINYQEHVSEYGVHMNFFILLASIKAIGMVLSFLLGQIIFHPLFGFLILCLHETFLSCGFSNYIQKDEGRNSFLDKNKESFYTLLGYIGFYLSCYNLSDFTVSQQPQNKLKTDDLTDQSLQNEDCYQSDIEPRKQIESEYRMIFKSLKWCLFYFIVYLISNQFIEQTSRRNMNMAFTCLTLSTIYLISCIEHFWVLLTIRHYSLSNLKLLIREAYTNNGLIAFLLANILTGFVNMSTNSLETPNMKAIVLLFAYSFAVSISVCFLDSLNNFFN